MPVGGFHNLLESGAGSRPEMLPFISILGPALFARSNED